MQNNFVTLANDQSNYSVNTILNAALQAVDPTNCVTKVISKQTETVLIHDLLLKTTDYDHIYLIGTGKAVLPMAKGVQDVLGDCLTGGFLIAKHEDVQIQAQLLKSIKVSLGTHPLPSRKSVDASKKMADFLKDMTERDLVICLISGGGSALMTLPQPGISNEAIQRVNQLLLHSGATINEMNTVRKHLDQIKGGGLARMVQPARLVTLILSDVLGDPLDVIASGPTVPDSTTFKDAIEVIDRYKLRSKVPVNVLAYLEGGKAGKNPETVKSGDACLKNSDTVVIGSLNVAAQAASERASQAGFDTAILTTKLEGEAREKGEELAQELVKIIHGQHRLSKPACLIAGGETTVTVHGAGKGGRNQETALSAARCLQDVQDCLFISLATDGEDGPTDAAGAYVDGDTIKKGEALGLSVEETLNENDAYTYLQKTGNLIKIGPTGTNVNDLVFMFAF